MKNFIFALSIGISLSISIFADEPQSMPEGASVILKKNQNALLNTTVVQFVENENRNGVVATYETLLIEAKLTLGKAYVGKDLTEEKRLYVECTKFLENENYEDIFIVGLNHDTLTNDGLILHTMVSFYTENRPCLLAWPIGIEKMKFGDQEIRLKKFTVDPKVAEKYYEQKSKK